VTGAFDPTTPNVARVYDHWLGGKDALPADRSEADRLLEIYPPLADMVRENRAFVAEAAAWAAGEGISQFIDLGAGLPASPSVHQAARGVMPTARVAYVDNDAVVLSHARALLATGDGVTAVAADLRDPQAVFENPELRAVVDPAWPVCVIFGAVLHFMDAGAARAVTAGYARRMVPGSCLVISVASFDDEGLGKQLAEEYTAAEWHNHPAADVASFFAGLDMVGPGVAEAHTWRSWQNEPVFRRRDGHVLVGVARLGALAVGVVLGRVSFFELRRLGGQPGGQHAGCGEDLHAQRYLAAPGEGVDAAAGLDDQPGREQLPQVVVELPDRRVIQLLTQLLAGPRPVEQGADQHDPGGTGQRREHPGDPLGVGVHHLSQPASLLDIEHLAAEAGASGEAEVRLVVDIGRRRHPSPGRRSRTPRRVRGNWLQRGQPVAELP
jgi:O-methyltransferase involved in polyketide biosynthesis